MRTKIVYIVSSDDIDIYLEQTYLSIFSLRKWNPDIYVELVCDQRTNATLTGKRAAVLKYVNKKTVVEVPDNYNKAQTSRWLKTSLRQHVEGDFLFIDSDTIISGDLRDIDNITYDLAGVANVHLPLGEHPQKKELKYWAKRDGWTFRNDIIYYNSGVLLVKETAVAYQLYDIWHKKWKEGLSRYHHIFDQSYLAAANEELGYPIKELNGIWNCQIVKNGMKFFYDAKILHYLAYKQFGACPPWMFYDKRICIVIKKKGEITLEIAHLVDNAKSCFPEKCRVIAEDDMLFYQSYGVRFLKENKWLFALINLIGTGFYSAGKYFKRKYKENFTTND